MRNSCSLVTCLPVTYPPSPPHVSRVSQVTPPPPPLSTPAPPSRHSPHGSTLAAGGQQRCGYRQTRPPLDQWTNGPRVPTGPRVARREVQWGVPPDNGPRLVLHGYQDPVHGYSCTGVAAVGLPWYKRPVRGLLSKGWSAAAAAGPRPSAADQTQRAVRCCSRRRGGQAVR